MMKRTGKAHYSLEGKRGGNWGRTGITISLHDEALHIGHNWDAATVRYEDLPHVISFLQQVQRGEIEKWGPKDAGT